MIHTLLYIDPGAGTLFYQAILSGVLTVSVFYKSITTYIKSKFTSKEKEEKAK